jgi:hypothetical protein
MRTIRNDKERMIEEAEYNEEKGLKRKEGKKMKK